MVCKDMHGIKRMQENMKKMEQLGIKVEVGGDSISIFKSAPKSNDFDLYFYNNFNTVEEFNVFCETLSSLIIDDDHLFELVTVLRDAQK